MALDDKYDDIKKLIDTGKEKGYLTYDQVNDLIPHDVHTPDDLDDLLTTIGTQGIDVLEGPKLPSPPRSIRNSTKKKPARTSNSTSLPALWKKPTTPSACICARWGQCRCSRAKAKWKSPSALSAGKCAF